MSTTANSNESPNSVSTRYLKSQVSVQVLLNTDLLLLIFQHLSPTDLFFGAQRVHPLWYLVVKETKSIQDKIHYRPLHPQRWPPQPWINPILQRAFPMFFQSNDWVDVYSFSQTLPESLVPPRRETHGSSIGFSPKTLTDPNATFRSMPVIIGSFNPITSINIVEERLQGMGFTERRGVLRIPPPTAGDLDNDEEEGLTMGKLMDICLGWSAGDPKGRSFVVRWKRHILQRSVLEERATKLQQSNVKEEPAALWSRITSLFSSRRETHPRETTPPRRSDFSSLHARGGLFDYHLSDMVNAPRQELLLEIVLFGAENTRDWFTDIVDHDAVVPEEWMGLEGKFGSVVEDIQYPYSKENAPWIVHPIRMPRKSTKWR